MDDELLQLEAELKRLRPVAPVLELTERIECELNSRRSRTQWWLWLALPAAAALAFVFASPERPAQEASAIVAHPAPARQLKPLFKPVASENVLLAARDEGLITLTDGSAARRVRQSYLDTITWKDSRSRASLTWSVPREEVRIVPVVFQ